MTTLYVLMRYGTLGPGDVMHFDDDALAQWHLRDAPECFSLTPPDEPEERALEAPPADRMVRRGKTRGA